MGARMSLEDVVDPVVRINRLAQTACESGLRDGPGPEITGDTRVVTSVAHAIGVAVSREMDRRLASRAANPMPQLAAHDVYLVLEKIGCRPAAPEAHRIAVDLNARLAAKSAAITAPSAPPPIERPLMPRRVEHLSVGDWRD